MCKVHYVVDFFIDSALNDPENNMTNLRIQKLLFLAQGWALARYDKLLFADNIEAWDFGPVVPQIYQRLKTSGSDKIKGVMDDDYASHFSEQEAMLLIDVLNAYDIYSTSGLVSLTHQRGTPWEKVYVKGKNNIIPTDSIRDYFKTLPPLQTFKLPHFTEDDFVGYRDEETGIYVLPKELDDDEC